MVYLGQNLDYILEHYPFRSTEVNSNNYLSIGTLCWSIEPDFIVFRLLLPMIPIWESLAKRAQLVLN